MEFSKYASEVRDLLDELMSDDGNEKNVLKDIGRATRQALLRIEMYDRSEKKKKKEAS